MRKERTVINVELPMAAAGSLAVCANGPLIVEEGEEKRRAAGERSCPVSGSQAKA